MEDDLPRGWHGLPGDITPVERKSRPVPSSGFQGLEEALGEALAALQGVQEMMARPEVPATLEEALAEVAALRQACEQLMSDNRELAAFHCAREEALKAALASAQQQARQAQATALARAVSAGHARDARKLLARVLSLFVADGQWARSVIVPLEDLNAWRRTASRDS